MTLIEPVQGPRFTAGYKSPTELTRAIAQHSGWAFDENDRLVDAAGGVVATSIEEAADIAGALRWYVSDRAKQKAFIAWSEMPHDSAARAAAVRGATR